MWQAYNCPVVLQTEPVESDHEYWVPQFSVQGEGGETLVHHKELELFNMGIEEDAQKYHPNAPAAILAAGARYTGKTIGVVHRVIRHMFDTAGARVAMFSKTIKVATAGGVWNDVIEGVDEWIKAGITEYTTTDTKTKTPGPKTDSKTRTIHFKIRNRFGGESQLILFSLDHDDEVKAKLKGTRFSLIWFSEFSLFEDPNIFKVSMMQLRMRHLQPWQHMFIADTNPSEDGEDSWIYKLWYQRRLEEADESTREFFQSLRLIEFFLEDNPFLTPGQLSWIKSLYKDDIGEYKREVDGKWVKGHGNKDKHFAGLFVPNTHIVGSLDTNSTEGDQIDVLPSTDTLYTGWDLGSAVNHAAGIFEKRMALIRGFALENNQPVERTIEASVWCALDELVSIGEKMQIQEFTREFHQKMRDIELRCGRKFIWQHWSDDTAINVPRASGEGYDALEVKIASNDEIDLVGVQKPKDSVRNRVKILRRLLRENRFFASARCVKIRKMLEDCKKGSKATEFVAWNEDKHVFDMVTYPILMETGEELLEELFKPRASSGPTTPPRWVQI